MLIIRRTEIRLRWSSRASNGPLGFASALTPERISGRHPASLECGWSRPTAVARDQATCILTVVSAVRGPNCKSRSLEEPRPGPFEPQGFVLGPHTRAHIWAPPSVTREWLVDHTNWHAIHQLANSDVLPHTGDMTSRVILPQTLHCRRDGDPVRRTETGIRVNPKALPRSTHVSAYLGATQRHSNELCIWFHPYLAHASSSYKLALYLVLGTRTPYSCRYHGHLRSAILSAPPSICPRQSLHAPTCGPCTAMHRQPPCM